ncbi:A-kinase anchor protein 200-like isoform X2 [Palaemon carinicauda]|uniref:A-kinase anchor protein 200-like isoform X2 n=1 Tax=Palaemon carinicauda TaxID=392227 RepID=UPI0035B58297
MTEGTEYYQHIGELQKALRERHEQLRSKIKTLHQELVQDEIESTQRVTLLLSQVDSVKREYELLEARTERLRQKKRQFELFVTSSNQRPTVFGTSNYGAHNVSDLGQFSTKLGPQPDAISTIRTSIQHNEQQFQHPFSPFSVPSAPNVYPSSYNIPASLQSTRINVQGPMMVPQPQCAENVSFPQRPVPQNGGNILGSSGHGQINYIPNNAYNAGDPTYNPQTLGNKATGYSHPSEENFAANIQINRSQYTTEVIPEKQQILQGVVINEDETTTGNLNRISSKVNYQHIEPERNSRDITITNNHDFNTESVKQPLSQSSTSISHHAQAFLSQEEPSYLHTVSGHYPQEFRQPVQHPSSSREISSHSHEAQKLPEGTTSVGFHPTIRESPKNQAIVKSCEYNTVLMEDSRSRNLYASDAINAEVKSQQAENVVMERELEVQKDQSHCESNRMLDDEQYKASVNMPVKQGEWRNVPESLDPSDEQLLYRPSSVEEENNVYQDVKVPNYVSDETQIGDVTVDNYESSLEMKKVDDTILLKETEVNEAEPVEERTPEVYESRRPSTFTQVEPESINQSQKEVTPRPPEPESTPESHEEVTPESTPESHEEVTPRPHISKEKVDAMKSDTSDDNEPSPTKKNAYGGTIQSSSQDTSLSRPFPQNAANNIDDDDSDFFDRDVPVTSSRAYKSLLGDMAIGGPGIPTESDSDDIEGQMSALAVRENPAKRPNSRPFASSIPSLRPKPPSTDTDSVDSVEAAIQAAMIKAKQEKADASDKNQESVKVTETSNTESRSSLDMEKEIAPVSTGGNKLLKGISKPSGALNLKLDSDSESCGVSGGDNESEDDFDFYD